MTSHTTQQIRNVALVGHGGSGKTTLAEAVLHAAGVTSRRGTVDDGSTVLDRDPSEIQRGSSVSLGLASFDWTTSNGDAYRINLLDTPGHPDFEAEVDAALAVADLALVVVNAPAGVEVGTETTWRKCDELGLPRMVFVTGEDRSRADFATTLARLVERFGSGCTPIELPLGEEDRFHGVADVLSEVAHEYTDGHHVEELPADIADEEHHVHDEVVEEIVSGDDAQLERYLDGEAIGVDELEATLANEVASGTVFPVLVGSGATGVGVDRLADYICELGPSPADRTITAVAGDDETPVVADPAGEPLVYVFKTVADQYVGRVSLFRVVTGTVRADAELVDLATGNHERLHGLHHVCGTEHTATDALVAGDLGAVSKLTGAMTGTTLASTGQSVRIPAPTPPVAHLAVALVPATQTDDDRLGEALHRLVEEDPSLVVDHDPLARRTVLRGVGDTHLAVALERLQQRAGVTVTTEELRVPYRRTIEGTAEAEGRVKKQSGGHGQFAVVDLRVAPLPRGGGFEFVDATVGGSIPKQFINAVELGIADVMASGGPSGIPIVDVRVECYDGKTHSVDSSDMAFRMAAAQGFLDAVDAARPVLLEPVARLQIRVPAELQGDVLGDLSGRRGRVVNSEQRGDDQWITGEAPVAEITRYAMDLRAMTGGRGAYWVTDVFDDILPETLRDRALAAYQRA